MIPIEIDISAAMSRLIPSKEEVNSYSRFLLDSISKRYMALWENQINSNLHQTKGIYQSGMNYELIDDYNAVFILEGKGVSKLALMIENGASAFDMKEGFKKSTKATRKNEGWYLTIPFRWSTSQAIAESSLFSNKMPNPVYNIAKEQGLTTESNLPPEFTVKNKRPEINQNNNTIAEYHHKSSIFVGIQKSEKPNHGGYTSFRRVSNNSDDNSWFHKGFEPHNFMGKALQDLSAELPDILALSEQQFFGK